MQISPKTTISDLTPSSKRVQVLFEIIEEIERCERQLLCRVIDDTGMINARFDKHVGKLEIGGVYLMKQLRCRVIDSHLWLTNTSQTTITKQPTKFEFKDKSNNISLKYYANKKDISQLQKINPSLKVQISLLPLLSNQQIKKDSLIPVSKDQNQNEIRLKREFQEKMWGKGGRKNRQGYNNNQQKQGIRYREKQAEIIKQQVKKWENRNRNRNNRNQSKNQQKNEDNNKDKEQNNKKLKNKSIITPTKQQPKKQQKQQHKIHYKPKQQQQQVTHQQNKNVPQNNNTHNTHNNNKNRSRRISSKILYKQKVPQNNSKVQQPPKQQQQQPPKQQQQQSPKQQQQQPPKQQQQPPKQQPKQTLQLKDIPKTPENHPITIKVYISKNRRNQQNNQYQCNAADQSGSLFVRLSDRLQLQGDHWYQIENLVVKREQNRYILEETMGTEARLIESLVKFNLKPVMK